jgi:hypothetical protein
MKEVNTVKLKLEAFKYMMAGKTMDYQTVYKKIEGRE